MINLPKNIPRYTWSTKPSASNFQNLRIFISDIGSGSLFYSNGTRWVPVGGQCILLQTNNAVNVTGTTTETETHNLLIPAGLMSSNGILEIMCINSMTNNANNKTLRIKLSSTSGTSGTNFLNSTVASIALMQYVVLIRNANSTNAQTGFTSSVASNSGGVGVSTSAKATATINTSSDSYLNFTVTLANAADSASFSGISVIYSEGW